MIREVIRPQDSSITINIPNSYINREVEFIVFPLDEQETPQKIDKQDISSLGGSLNKYANISKIDLEDSAWEKHVTDKYNIIKALIIFADKNLDFVDSVLCAKSIKYEVKTFDKKLNKCIENHSISKD